MEPINPNIPGSPDALVVPVSKGTRFINLLVDGLLLGAANYFVTRAIGSSFGYLIGLVLQFCYYYFQEKDGGQTIGKRLTNTKAVMADGSPLTDDAARTRNLWRLIPLVDALSFLFSEVGWHDKYSNTRVVSAK